MKFATFPLRLKTVILMSKSGVTSVCWHQGQRNSAKIIICVCTVLLICRKRRMTEINKSRSVFAAVLSSINTVARSTQGSHRITCAIFARAIR